MASISEIAVDLFFLSTSLKAFLRSVSNSLAIFFFSSELSISSTSHLGLLAFFANFSIEFITGMNFYNMGLGGLINNSVKINSISLRYFISKLITPISVSTKFSFINLSSSLNLHYNNSYKGY